MTDEELDLARAKEAGRIRDSYPDQMLSVIAARLAREGWMPLDPLEAEVREILGDDFRLWGDVSLAYFRKALERGIEIGRTTPGRSDG